ncbi:hypothetical protein Tco_0872645 [Tanacetum coccineum]
MPNRRLLELEDQINSLMKGPRPAHTSPAHVEAVYLNSRSRNLNEPTTLNTFAFRERTARKTPKKVLVREEAKFLITRNVNSISLANEGDERSNEKIEMPETTEEPTETGTETPLKRAETKDEVKDRPEIRPINTHENNEVEETPDSQPIAYYLKHKINKKLIKGLVDNNIFNNSLSGT